MLRGFQTKAVLRINEGLDRLSNTYDAQTEAHPIRTKATIVGAMGTLALAAHATGLTQVIFDGLQHTADKISTVLNTAGDVLNNPGSVDPGFGQYCPVDVPCLPLSPISGPLN